MPTKLAQPAQLAFGAGFGFVTGYANLICIARYSAFGTMMTGNLLMMAKSFVEGGMSAGAGHKIPLPLFFALIIGWRHFGILCYHIAGKTRFRTMTLMGPTILFVIVAAESAWFFLDKHLIPERWNVWFVAFCFGVQSSVTFPAMGVPTMLATGHLTNIWFTYIEVLWGEKPKGDLKKTLYPTINAGSIVIGQLQEHSPTFISRAMLGRVSC